PASFDTKKLDWLAGQYMRQKGLDELTELAMPYLQDASLLPSEKGRIDLDRVKRIVGATRPGLPCLSRMVKEADFFFKRPIIDEDKKSALFSDNAQKITSKVLDYLSRRKSVSPEDLKELITTLSEDMNLTKKDVMMTLRLALSGRSHGPELYSVISILGVDESVERLKKVQLIKSNKD
ncbi:MAG: hypothetical protein ACE5KK_03945, partial [Candidatus Brocadiales bacterium]